MFWHGFTIRHHFCYLITLSPEELKSTENIFHPGPPAASVAPEPPPCPLPQQTLTSLPRRAVGKEAITRRRLTMKS